VRCFLGDEKQVLRYSANGSDVITALAVMTVSS